MGATSSSLVKLEQENQEWLTQFETCQQCGLPVSAICLSGIACQVYDPGVASTLHSFYGLGAADLMADLLITRTSSDCGM